MFSSKIDRFTSRQTKTKTRSGSFYTYRRIHFVSGYSSFW